MAEQQRIFSPKKNKKSLYKLVVKKEKLKEALREGFLSL